jgi:hypothetical protein
MVTDSKSGFLTVRQIQVRLTVLYAYRTKKASFFLAPKMPLRRSITTKPPPGNGQRLLSIRQIEI